MSEFETTIRKAAEDLAAKVVGALRGMTLADLASLTRSAATAVVKKVRAKRQAVAKLVTKPKRGAKTSPKQAAARKLQGRYIGLLRNLSPKEKLAIKALAKKQSVAAAVAEMEKRRGRS